MRDRPRTGLVRRGRTVSRVGGGWRPAVPCLRINRSTRLWNNCRPGPSRNSEVTLGAPWVPWDGSWILAINSPRSMSSTIFGVGFARRFRHAKNADRDTYIVRQHASIGGSARRLRGGRLPYWEDVPPGEERGGPREDLHFHLGHAIRPTERHQLGTLIARQARLGPSSMSA